jgi:hypothetical protein
MMNTLRKFGINCSINLTKALIATHNEVSSASGIEQNYFTCPNNEGSPPTDQSLLCRDYAHYAGSNEL